MSGVNTYREKCCGKKNGGYEGNGRHIPCVLRGLLRESLHKLVFFDALLGKLLHLKVDLFA